MAGIDKQTQIELEAAAFRTLTGASSLNATMFQNIDIMNLAGFLPQTA